MQQYTFVCAPSLVQYGALAAFEDIHHHINEYKEKRDLIYKLLSEKFDTVKPEGAFYIMINVGDGEEFTKWAIKKNVLVVPGNAFSQKNTHVRISYATNIENILKGAQLLTKY
jgi:aspartate aminotransferase/aminotransferase